MIARHAGSLLSLALLLQVVLAGWMMPCAEGTPGTVREVAATAHHHEEAPGRDDREHRPAGCQASACTVLMTSAARGFGLAVAGMALQSEAPRGAWVSIAIAPELPPPRG